MQSAVVQPDMRRSVKTAHINLQTRHHSVHVCRYTYMFLKGVFPLKKLLGQISPIHRPTCGCRSTYQRSASPPAFIELIDFSKLGTMRTGNLYSADQYSSVGAALRNWSRVGYLVWLTDGKSMVRRSCACRKRVL